MLFCLGITLTSRFHYVNFARSGPASIRISMRQQPDSCLVIRIELNTCNKRKVPYKVCVCVTDRKSPGQIQSPLGILALTSILPYLKLKALSLLSLADCMGLMMCSGEPCRLHPQNWLLVHNEFGSPPENHQHTCTWTIVRVSNMAYGSFVRLVLTVFVYKWRKCIRYFVVWTLDSDGLTPKI